jgi:hypothetical protein
VLTGSDFNYSQFKFAVATHYSLIVGVPIYPFTLRPQHCQSFGRFFRDRMFAWICLTSPALLMMDALLNLLCWKFVDNILFFKAFHDLLSSQHGASSDYEWLVAGDQAFIATSLFDPSMSAVPVTAKIWGHIHPVLQTGVPPVVNDGNLPILHGSWLKMLPSYHHKQTEILTYSIF